MKSVYSVYYSHEVLVDEPTGRHVLRVLCGGIAMYDVDVELTAEEIEAFRADPKSVDRIARDVQQTGKRR